MRYVNRPQNRTFIGKLWDDVREDLRVGFDSYRGGKNTTNKVWAKNKYQRVTHWKPIPKPATEV